MKLLAHAKDARRLANDVSLALHSMRLGAGIVVDRQLGRAARSGEIVVRLADELESAPRPGLVEAIHASAREGALDLTPLAVLRPLGRDVSRPANDGRRALRAIERATRSGAAEPDPAWLRDTATAGVRHTVVAHEAAATRTADTVFEVIDDLEEAVRLR